MNQDSGPNTYVKCCKINFTPDLHIKDMWLNKHLKKCGSGASSQKWPITDHSDHKINMYTMTLSIILNSHVRSAKPPPPPSTNFYLIQNLNSWCCVFTITVHYILPDCKVLHAIYNATSIGENILPVNYQVLQQHP